MPLIKNKLYRYLLKKLKGVFSALYRAHESVEFEQIKRSPNVDIDATFRKGNSSGFEIHGQCKNLIINRNVECRKFCNFLLYQNASLVIRENVFFNNYCSINCLGQIEIGENSLFGEGVKLYDHNHDYHFEQDQLKVERDRFNIGFVKIGKNCWIGSNVTILQNVEIGDNVIIGANCLVYKSIPSNSIVKADTAYTIVQK